MSVAKRFDDNNFTWLRLMFALLVVLGHFQLLNGVAHPSWPFNYAAASVDCFFVVSGYLVTNSFDRDSDFWRFYIRRVFRIYPLYLTVVAAQTLALGLLAPSGFLANARSLLRYFAVNAVFANFLQYDIADHVLRGLDNPSLNPSLWTLKIEFGFYLILPFLWLAVRRYGGAMLVAIFVCSALFFEGMNHLGHAGLAKQLPGQLQFFAVGMAGYLYRDHLKISPAAGLGLSIASGVLVTLLLRAHPPVIFPLVVGAFVLATALRAPAFQMKADISYGVYLLHGPLIQLSLLLGFYRPGWLGLAPTLATVLILALIAERAIELPGIALGRRLSMLFSSGPSPRPVDAAQPVKPDALTVLVLNDFCYVQGGASQVAIDEAISLAQSGVKVIFVGAVGPASAELRAAPLRVECLEQHELLDVGRHPWVLFQALWNLRAGQRVRAILRDLQRDRTVVHLHGYTKALTTSPVRVARRMGFPVVCTLHDFYAACPNGAFFDFAQRTPCTKRALSGSCIAAHCDKRHYAHKLFRVARGMIQQWLGRFPGAVLDYISLSNGSAMLLAPYLPSGARIYPLQNVIDVVPQPPVRVAENREILCVGRLDLEKGVDLLAGVTSQLGLPVTFVGDGPMRAEVETMPGTSVTGWVSRETVHLHLERARCLVFPSLWYETYGLVVAEAASRGIPAIVSDISAAAERVRDGVTGWRFHSGDAADLARCLNLVEDDAVVRAAGAAAYQAFWNHPETRDAHAENLLRIYGSVLKY